MTPKPWHHSKTLWINLLSLAAVAIGGVLELNGVLELTSQQVALITIALSIVNAALRIFATAQPVSVGSSVPSQAGKSP